MQLEAISICQGLELFAFAHDPVAVSSLPPSMDLGEKRQTNESYRESFKMYKWRVLVNFLRWSWYIKC